MNKMLDTAHNDRVTTLHWRKVQKRYWVFCRNVRDSGGLPGTSTTCNTTLLNHIHQQQCSRDVLIGYNYRSTKAWVQRCFRPLNVSVYDDCLLHLSILYVGIVEHATHRYQELTIYHLRNHGNLSMRPTLISTDINGGIDWKRQSVPYTPIHSRNRRLPHDNLYLSSHNRSSLYTHTKS